MQRLALDSGGRWKDVYLSSLHVARELVIEPLLHSAMTGKVGDACEQSR